VYTLPGAAGSSANTSKKVKDLDTDTVSEPIVYKGGEQVSYLGGEVIPAYVGGEKVIAHRAGEVVLDKDGKPVVVSTLIKGDGLGVRRNY
jgi:hypothetical protein